LLYRPDNRGASFDYFDNRLVEEINRLIETNNPVQELSGSWDGRQWPQ